MNIFASWFPAIVDVVVRATILLGLAGIAGLLLKNRSAALRHTVRACALSALLLLPALSSLMPAWRWQALPQFLVASAVNTATPAALPAAPESQTADRQMAAPPAHTSATTQPANYQPTPPAPSQSQLAMNWPELYMKIRMKTLMQLLMMVWLLGAVLVALRLLVSRSRFALLIRRAAVVDDSAWISQVQQIAHRLGIRRSVALLESQDTEVPLTSGAWRPRIVLSPDHAEWSPLRRDAILHHELAHIRRLDALAQALCHAAIAMYWFHPLVWLTVRAMRAEREQACDDYVLAAGTKPSQYAHELLEIASSLRQPEFITALALARRSQLEGRVMALLNPAQRRGSISQKTTWIVAALTLCIVLPLAALQTATPQKQQKTPSSDQRTISNSPQAPATPATATEVAQPSVPEEPQEKTPATEATAAPPPQSPTPQVAPLPPAAAAPRVAGVVDGVAGGVSGGVAGGVPGGVRGGVNGGVRSGVRIGLQITPRSVPAIPPVPVSPQAAPAAPQIPSPPPVPPQAAPAVPQTPTPPPAPPAVAPRPVPALPKTRTPQAVPAPQPAPVPIPVPIPEAAPSAPAIPSTPPAEAASPAPQEMSAPRAASTAATLSALKARLLAIHAQAGAQPHEIEALRSRIAALATTASAEAPLVARLRAQTAVIAARSSSASDQVAALRAQLAALAGNTAQAASTAPEVAALRARIAALPHVASTPAHSANGSEPCAADASPAQKKADHQ